MCNLTIEWVRTPYNIRNRGQLLRLVVQNELKHRTAIGPALIETDRIISRTRATIEV